MPQPWKAGQLQQLVSRAPKSAAREIARAIKAAPTLNIAAAMLGTSRRTLGRLAHRLGLHEPASLPPEPAVIAAPEPAPSEPEETAPAPPASGPRKKTKPRAPRFHCPPDGDPSWQERCRPLLERLRTKQTIAQLNAWRREERITENLLIQMIAWCENRKVLVYRDGLWGTIRSFR